MIIPSKLKVVELRAELSARGLDTKGVKAALVDRLQQALDKENGESDNTAQSERSQSAADTSLNESQDEETGGDEGNDTAIAQDKTLAEDETSDAVSESPEKKAQPIASESSAVKDGESAAADASAVAAAEVKSPSSKNEASPIKEKAASSSPRKDSDLSAQGGNEGDLPEQQAEDEPQTTDGASMDVDVKEEKSDEKVAEDAEKQNGVSDETATEIKEEGDIKQETEESESKDGRKRKRSRSQSPSSEAESPSKFNVSAVPREKEPDIDDSKITLSWYDSDLSLNLDPATLFSASPLSFGGFGYIWSGARGTHGFTKGKLCYQAKITKYLDVSHLADEANPNVLRVGWSTFSNSLQLGEDPLSYGYGGTGKFSVGCKFQDYGKPFGLGDVITAYLEFTDDEIIISYSLNGDHQGPAVTVPRSELAEGQALAPHVLTKNIDFSVNFGQEDEPWAGPIEEGFTFLGQVPVEETTPGPRRPENRSDCEILMMCGLPGCGKTEWANKHSKEHPEKLYNILGTNALIDKMKVNGLPRKANYSGRWDVLIDKCTKCLTRLMDVGSKRRRNYILDQTNVYPSAQRRKMRVFDGFIKKAVVIVPTDEEFKSRVEKQAKEEKKDVPESAVLEMKANFSLPDKKLFDEVIYAELPEEEAQTLIEKYSKEAAAAGYTKKIGGFGAGGGSGYGVGGRGAGGGPPFKKFRGGGGGFHGGGTPSRHDGGGGFRRGPPPLSQGTPGGGFRRGGPNNRGGWSREGQDRWRDNRNQGGYRHSGGGNDRSGWRGPPMAGGQRGPRDYDRGPSGGRQGSGGGGYGDRNRGGGGPRTGGGGYNRDRNQYRGGTNDRKPRVDHKYGSGTGTTGGSVTAGGGTSQWGGNQYGQSSGAVASNQGWGQNQTNQGWGGGQTQQTWNYQQPQQQQWKGGAYSQQQSSYGGQGYSQQNYGGWQNYQGYPQNYGSQQSAGSWSGQNNDGSYGSYTQNWPGWGYSTQSGATGSQAGSASAHAPNK